MKLLLLTFFGLLACASAAMKPGLRVRFSVGLNLSSYFIDLPRTQADSITQGWVQKIRPEGALHSLSLFCPLDDVHVCVLYDDAGYVAGIQIAVGTDELTNYPQDPSQIGMTSWSTLVDGEIKSYWVVTQYFVSGTTLTLNATERAAMHPNSEVLYDGSIWIPNYDGSIMNVSTTISEMETNTLFKKQACVPLMGRHYFYNMTTSFDCNVPMLPWFLLTHQNQLVGSGFVTHAKFPSSFTNKWFETPGKAAVKVIVPNASECFYNMADTYGVVSVHIYYVNNPWSLLCINEHSNFLF